MKKRNCRRTPEEQDIHEKAVKLKKMTDAQLMNYIRDRVNEAYEKGRKRGSDEVIVPIAQLDSTDETYLIRQFIEMIADLPGIGIATMSKINDLARRKGYMS